MRDVIRYANRLIMLDAGKVVVDRSGEEKTLTIEDLLKKFDQNSDIQLDDKLILSK